MHSQCGSVSPGFAQHDWLESHPLVTTELGTDVSVAALLSVGLVVPCASQRIRAVNTNSRNALFMSPPKRPSAFHALIRLRTSDSFSGLSLPTQACFTLPLASTIIRVGVPRTPIESRVACFTLAI